MKTEERVLKYMEQNGSIDQQRANRDLGCSRLAEYIRRLKEAAREKAQWSDAAESRKIGAGAAKAENKKGFRWGR